MTRTWLSALAVSALMWVAILGGVSLFAQSMAVTIEEIAADPVYRPPACTRHVCDLYGPGGFIAEWKMHVLLNSLKGHAFRVPGQTCASACAIAVGMGLALGMDIAISPRAVFVPHNMPQIRATDMPAAFKRLMLAGKPFAYAKARA